LRNEFSESPYQKQFYGIKLNVIIGKTGDMLRQVSVAVGV
jgi:hypothetical protein